MVITTGKQVEYLVVDTTAFIQNAPLHNVAANIITVQEVINEITNKRQLKRLCVLPYDLVVKDVFPENVKAVTDFTKKTGDYPCLSATDIKVMALTYQLEKEMVGTEHLRKEPIVQRTVNVITKKKEPEMVADVSGFYIPSKSKGKEENNVETDEKNVTTENNQEENIKVDEDKEDETNDVEEYEDVEEESLEDIDKKLKEKFEALDCNDLEEIDEENDVLQPVESEEEIDSEDSEEESDNDDSWITPSNVQEAKKQMNSELVEEKSVKVACMTTDFAMQNVLKQMNLNVSALDGRLIKQLRTFILRCYACFSTTSIMTKTFCPKCGNQTLKRVAVSLDKNGKQVIHINGRKPLTGRGKRFSLPTIKGGKHSNNPRLFEDQPMPDQRPTRLARMKNNPMEDDYIAGFSPFVMRDVNSKSAQLCIRPGTEVKHWMRKNPNEARRKRK